MKVKWARISTISAKMPNTKCRLVIQERGYGENMDELLAGTPCFVVASMLLQKAAKHRDRKAW